MTRKKDRGPTPPRGKDSGRSERAHRGERAPFTFEFKLRIVKLVVESEAPQQPTARAFGLSPTTLSEWVRAYREHGEDGLRPFAERRPAPPKKAAPEAFREAVIGLREENPEMGTRRIRDMLARFDALGVSETQVRKILHEAGLIAPQPVPAREHPPRRFERAQPNQMWQSDIFTFLLRRQQRLYLAAFMDDHSRFIVSYALAHHQRSELVLEALSRGIAAWGEPKEILTDQGRQYTAWRGETDFEETLRQHGIRHIKSRPQHPQTLGKVERFWKTLWDEFLSRTVFADYADCDRRLGLFVQAYNFQRPHQALGGLVPADRFFHAAPHVRATVEKAIQENAMRLAHEKPPRKPFYLVGQLGDRNLSISAEGSGLNVKLGDEEPTRIEWPTREGDEYGSTQGSRWSRSAPEAPTESGEEDPALAARHEGARPGRPAEMPDDPGGAERREERRGREPRGGDQPGAVLPVREEGALGDAGGARARGLDGRLERPGHEAAGGAGGRARSGQAAPGAAPLPHAIDRETWADHDGEAGTAEEDEGPRLGARWRQALALHEEEVDGEESEGIELAPTIPFDPEAGWRGRSLIWDRKLVSCDAPLDDGELERLDGGQAEAKADNETQEAEDLHGGPGRAGGGAGSLSSRPRGALGAADGLGRGPRAGYVTESLPDDPPSRAGRPHRGYHSWQGGSPREAGERGGARDPEGRSPQEERQPRAPTRHDDEADGARDGGDEGIDLEVPLEEVDDRGDEGDSG